MPTRRIKFCFVLVILFFSWAHFASADVVINKVNLDPIGERFIELYNDSSLDQSLTNWSIKRKSSSGIEYSLVSSSRLKDKIIAANGYFLLTNEETYTGSLSPDATWAKSYTFADNNTIILYNNDEVVDDWLVSKTSNNENSSDNNSSDTNNTEEDNSEDSTSDVGNTDNNKSDIFKITAKIAAPKIVTAGIPFTFSSTITDNKGGSYAVGRSVWNLGDGMTKEFYTTDSFEYSYDYPGEYVVNLSYFNSSFSKTPDATSRITVKVISANLYISSIGDGEDAFIELENKSSYEIVLSNWVITAGTHYFIIPEGTTLLPNKKLKLSPKITMFNSSDMYNVIITNPSNEVVATYPVKQSVAKPVVKSVSIKNILANNYSGNIEQNYKAKDQQVINLNDLGADVLNADVNISNQAYAWIGLVVIIGLGVVSFWLIKKKDNIKDYIDEEIRAEDMTIVE